jgi:hypothetical protein
MKTIIHQITMGLLMLLSIQLNARETHGDTIIINLGQQKRLIIEVKDKEDLRDLKNYDINQILHDLNQKVDSSDSSKYVKMEDLQGTRYRTAQHFAEDEIAFDYQNFKRINISGNIDADVQQAEEFKITAVGPNIGLDQLSVKQEGEDLNLYFEGSEPVVRVKIVMPELEEIKVDNGGRLYLMGFSQPKQVIEADDESVVIGDIEIRELVVTLDEGSKLKLQGFGDQFTGNLDDGSLLDAFDYSITDANLVIAGGSVARINALGNVNTRVIDGEVLNKQGNKRIASEGKRENVSEIGEELLKNMRIKLSNYEFSVKFRNWEDLEDELDDFSEEKIETKEFIEEETDNSSHVFNLELGFNNYLESGSFPDAEGADYSVKPWGSWYFAVNSTHHFWVQGPLFLQWGKSISWYNFKFNDAGVRIRQTPEGTRFEADDRSLNEVKSKLTASYLNMNLIPMFDFSQRRRLIKSYSYESFNITKYKTRGFRIGLGPYLGYRIGSHSKFVYKEGSFDREKEKERKSFNLSPWRYGLRLQGGYKAVDFFFDYDLNPLFREDRGPNLNAFSFGILL